MSDGRPASRDDADLRLAAGELATGRALLAMAHQIVDRRARRDAFVAAVAKLQLAARALEDVIDRYEH